MIERTQETWYSLLERFFERRRYLIDDILEWYPIDYLDIAAEFKSWGNLIVHGHDSSSERMDQIMVVDKNYEEPFRYMDEEEWRFIFGKKLRYKLIKQFGIQEDVAEEIRLSRISLNRYCSGKATPSLYNINKIANNLKISISEFYISAMEQTRVAVVRPHAFWDEAIENIKMERPDIAAECVGWYPANLDEIAIRTKERDRYLYNVRDHHFVYICGESYEEWVNTWNNKWNHKKHDEFIDETEWREQFAYRLSEIMKRCGINREELSYKAGISFISLYSYLTGKSTPSLYNATKIVRVLECSLTDFQVMRSDSV